MTGAATAAADAPSAVEDLLASTSVDIGGVPYIAAERTAMSFAHRIYLEQIVLEAGLEEPARFMRRDAPLAANAKQLLLALYRSGRTFDFLAGALVPEGKPWTEAEAKVTALRLAQLTDPVTTRALQDLLAVLVAGFFMAGLNSFGTSPNASALTMEPSEPEASAARSNSADTAASSADSPAMTLTG